MDSSGNHNGRQRCDWDGQQQRQWAMAMQWASGRQSNHGGQWGGGGTMDSTICNGQLPADKGTKMGAMLVFWLVGEL